MSNIHVLLQPRLSPAMDASLVGTLPIGTNPQRPTYRSSDAGTSTTTVRGLQHSTICEKGSGSQLSSVSARCEQRRHEHE